MAALETSSAVTLEDGALEVDASNGHDDNGKSRDRMTAYCGGPKLDGKKVFFEAICGISVSLAMVPEAVSFSFVAGVDPFVGMTSAWIICVVTALCGGRPAMICGATGAIAALVGDLVHKEGVEYLFVAVMLMGLIQLAVFVLKADRLVRLIPHPVMIGFCNGLAIVIGMAQFTLFKRADKDADDEDDHRRRLSGGTFDVLHEGGWVSGSEGWWTAAIVLIAFLISFYAPRITKKVPASLVAIVVATGFEWAVVRNCFKRGTQTVSDFASLSGTLPKPVWLDNDYDMPGLTSRTLGIVAPYSVVMAIVGLIESLLTLSLVDELTETKGDTNRECFGQGLANLLCGILGGMGGCATIGQAMLNVQSGARSRASGTAAGLFLLLVTLAAHPAISTIPVAALAGVMFNICAHTFEWRSLRIVFFSALPARLRRKFGDRSEYKVPRADAATIVLVTVVTLFTDLAVAVISGIIFSCLTFAWNTGSALYCDVAVEKTEGNRERKVYTVRGPLFFASTTNFLECFDVAGDPDECVVRFDGSSVADFSGLEALNVLTERYERHGKTIRIERVRDRGTHKLLRKAGSLLVGQVRAAVEDLDTACLIPKDLTGSAIAEGPASGHLAL